MTAPRVVLLNNSSETFTPTISGAVATCLWEVARASTAGSVAPMVVTRGADADPYPWPDTVVVPARPAEPDGLRRTVARGRRRLGGWAHEHQESFLRQVLPVLREVGPDVIICNNDPEIAGYLARRLPGTVVVHWFHNLEYAADRRRRDYAVRGAVRSVAVSRYLARAVEAAYRLTPGSVPCVHPGIDSERFGGRPARADGLPVIGFLGRVCVEKGVDVLMRACLELAAVRQDFAVQLVGDTNWDFTDGNPYGLLIDRLVDELRATGVRVDRTGHVPRTGVPDALARSDLQVVPSRWDEPFGLVVLEGMATGLPVVASAAGGVPEIVGDGGLLVAREDASALASALATLLDDPEQRAALAQRARVVARGFTWQRTWTGLLDAAGVAAGAG